MCPVDCIYEYTGEDRDKLPNQLYIDPEECIDCGVCEPECPWEAIFEDERVPDVFQADIALNADDQGREGRVRRCPRSREKPKPTPEQVAANKEKWGFTD